MASALTAAIYPNPITNGRLYFGRQVASFGIFDVKGRLVQYGLQADHASIEGFAVGIYFIKMDEQVQKLIVE